MDPAGTAPGPSWDRAAPATGTTIVAVAFEGGVVVGADSRVSTGAYVSNRASDKLTVLDQDGFAWLLRSGSAADTQAVGDYGERWRGPRGGAAAARVFFSMGCAVSPGAGPTRTGGLPGSASPFSRVSHGAVPACPGSGVLTCATAPPFFWPGVGDACPSFFAGADRPKPASPLPSIPHALSHAAAPYRHPFSVRYFVDQLASELGSAPSVSAVAHLVKKMNYSNKEALLGAMLVGGWDAERGGQVYGIPIGGSLVRLPWATDGSGSTYIWGYLDSAWKPGLDRAGAEALVATALALAISIDGSSGGMARLVTVTAAGAERKLIRGDQVEQFWDAVEPSKPGGEGMVVV